MTRDFLPLSLLALSLAGSAWANPHAASPGASSLDVSADGTRVHLLSAETAGDGAARLLHFASSDGGNTWSEAIRVDEGQAPPYSPHRGFDPQIAVSGDKLVAAWTTAGTDRWGSGPIATARSDDGGRTWWVGPNPADDGLTTGHGFLDLAADAEGVFHLVWLDSRDGRQGLRYAKSADGGANWSPNRTLQSGTCECCRNTLSIGPGGNPVVLFRNHDPRDMKVVFTENGEWKKPLVAGDFGWNFDGCPHAGGGLAATRSGLSALVWTGSPDHAGVHFVRPGHPGSTRLGGPSATHPDLASDASSNLFAVWQERTEEGSVLRHTLSHDDGATWSEARPVSEAAPSATHPLAVAIADGFLVAWTEKPEDSPARWRSIRVPLP